MTDRLFVYGTLAPGRPNEHILRDVPGTWEPATVRGHLFKQGWGAAAGYPGIVMAEDPEAGDVVNGFVFTSETLPAHWSRLDQFEGPGYTRVLTRATLENGTKVTAYIYALSGKNQDDSGGPSQCSTV